jgi:ligand-binding SRPBCC domain-containing protein
LILAFRWRQLATALAAGVGQDQSRSWNDAVAMVRYQRLRLLAWVLSADTNPPTGLASVHCETTVSASPQETFAFFADASNLERLTPPWLNFRILTPMPVQMRPGVEIDYLVSLYGLPIPWRSQIDVWEPGVRFVDRQKVGPYRWWRHDHRFEPASGGTLVIDHVEYAPRGRWFTREFVRRDLERIFAYRQNALRHIFLAPQANEGRHGARAKR